MVCNLAVSIRNVSWDPYCGWDKGAMLYDFGGSRNCEVVKLTCKCSCNIIFLPTIKMCPSISLFSSTPKNIQPQQTYSQCASTNKKLTVNLSYQCRSKETNRTWYGKSQIMDHDSWSLWKSSQELGFSCMWCNKPIISETVTDLYDQQQIL